MSWNYDGQGVFHANSAVFSRTAAGAWAKPDTTSVTYFSVYMSVCHIANVVTALLEHLSPTLLRLSHIVRLPWIVAACVNNIFHLS